MIRRWNQVPIHTRESQVLTRILNFYCRNFAILVVIFGAVAYRYPDFFTPLKPYNQWFFGLTMFGIGIVLDVEDFVRIAKRPAIVLIGSFAQFTIMPLGAFVISRLFGLPPELAVGLILTGSAPGAMASNVMSYIARADTAYSVSLTTVSTLLCPLLTPALTLFLARSELPVNFVAMFLNVVLMVLVPLVAGFGVKLLFKKRIEKILPVFPAISVTFIIFICSLVIALNRDKLAAVTPVVLSVAILLNIYGMIGGYYSQKRLSQHDPKRSNTLRKNVEFPAQAVFFGTQNRTTARVRSWYCRYTSCQKPNAVLR